MVHVLDQASLPKDTLKIIERASRQNRMPKQEVFKVLVGSGLDLTKALSRHEEVALNYSLHLSKDQDQHQLVFGTFSFKAFENFSTDHNRPIYRKSVSAAAIKPNVVWSSFDQFYRHLLGALIPHYERVGKRHLQPLTYAFLDLPWSRNASGAAWSYGSCNPIAETPHVHAVFRVRNELMPKWRKTNFWAIAKRRCPTLGAPHFAEIPSQDVMRVTGYSCKLLKHLPFGTSADELWHVYPRLPTNRISSLQTKIPQEREGVAKIHHLRELRQVQSIPGI